MTTIISKVTNKKDKKDFINFPHDLYSGDNNYVPELYLNISEILSEKKNPFFKHSNAELFLAKDDQGKTVGRIAAIQDNNYNEHHDSNIGFFGFFDVINDYSVAKQLLDTAYDWVKANGAVQILGPTNFTTNDTAGVLVDGYDSPPTVMMTYNKPYYSQLLEQYGFSKEMDLFAYLIPTDEVNEKSLRLATMLQERLKRKGITIRTSTKKSKKSDIKKIKPVYLAAWEFEGQLVGFGVALPDINEITKDFNKGKLLPFNFIKLLTRKSKVSLIRIILLGVLKEYRKLGIEAIFFANYIKAAKENNLRAGEASWILESNTMMVQAAEKLNGKRYKTYRIYSKAI
jgi:GNAT superfamily N-acetyltransferase